MCHIRRFHEYFNHIHILIGSSTLQFLQFRYQKGITVLFFVVKSIEVTSVFIFRLMKKIARWRYCWNIWHLIIKTKISLLVVHYQKSIGCLKNQQDLRNSDLEVCCTNVQPKLKKLWSSKSVIFKASGDILKFIQYWLNIST